MSSPTRTPALWGGLQVWLAGSRALSPSLPDWERELSGLHTTWRAEQRLEDLRGLELLRRALALQLLPVEDSSLTALVPRRGREPREALERLFNGPDLEALGDLAGAAVPAALCARVSDLRWLLLRDAGAAHLAQAAYLAVAGQADMGRPSQAVAGGDALLRAACLSQERGDPTGVEAGLAELLPRAMLATPAVGLHRCMQAALRVPGANRPALSDLSIARAESELSRRDFRWGRTFYGHAERALSAAGRESEAQTLGVVRASVLADEARFRRHQGEPQWISASFYRRAIDELGLIPGTGELAADLAREGELGAANPVGPYGVQDEAGRFATVVEEVLGACDDADPRERARLFAALPLEPEFDDPAPAGPAVLDLFLRRFRARARGRFHPLAAGGALRREPTAAVEAARVGAWIQTARAWLVPVVDALRRHDAGNARARSAALECLFEGSSAEFAQRSEILARGAAACWEGDPVGGLGILVPQLANLRACAPVQRLLQRSPALALVDGALMHHPEGFALAAVVESGASARLHFSQVAADLILWWTLCLAARVED